MIPYLPVDIWWYRILPLLDAGSILALAEAAPELAPTIKGYRDWEKCYKAITARDLVLLPSTDILQAFTQRYKAVAVWCKHPHMPSTGVPAGVVVFGEHEGTENPKMRVFASMSRSRRLRDLAKYLLFGSDKRYINSVVEGYPGPFNTLHEQLMGEPYWRGVWTLVAAILYAKRVPSPSTFAQTMYLPDISDLETVHAAMKILEDSESFPTDVFRTEVLLEKHGICDFDHERWRGWKVNIPEEDFPEPIKSFCSFGRSKYILLAASGRAYSTTQWGNQIVPIATPSKITSVQTFDPSYHFKYGSSMDLNLSRSKVRQPNGVLFLGENGMVYYHHLEQPTITRIPGLEFIVKLSVHNGGFFALNSEGRLFFMGTVTRAYPGEGVMRPVGVDLSTCTSGEDAYAREIPRSRWPAPKTGVCEPHASRESGFDTDFSKKLCFYGKKYQVCGSYCQEKGKRGKQLPSRDLRRRPGVPYGFMPVEIIFDGIIIDIVVTEKRIAAKVVPHITPSTEALFYSLSV